MNETLSQFQSELQREGLRVVPHRDHLCVRLPLFASVRVRLHEGELKLDLQAGPTRPGRALAWTAIGATALVGSLAAVLGVGAATLTAAFGGVALLALELGQLILADGCATRLALRWASRPLARVTDRASILETTPIR